MKNYEKDFLKRWFKYHHFNTMCVDESHSKFIGHLSEIEDIGNFHSDDLGGMDKIWTKIRETINIMTDEQIAALVIRIKRI